jgi:hypothetical protein
MINCGLPLLEMKILPIYSPTIPMLIWRIPKANNRIIIVEEYPGGNSESINDSIKL